MSVKAYRAVFFDIGGTLLRITRDPQEAALEAISHLGRPPENYGTVLRAVYREWQASGGPPEEEDLPETWIDHHRCALTLSGFDGDAHAAGRIMEDVFLADSWEVFPEVPEVLRVLAERGQPMGVVSNWPASLKTTLEKAGLSRYFPVIVASGAVGYAKPHPRIFQIGSDRLGVAPSQALYVGDSVEHDVAGATAAGMDAVLIARNDSPGFRGRSIRSLVELPSLLSH